MNAALNELLASYKVSDEVLSLYALVLEDVFKTNDKERELEKQRLESDIRSIEVKIKDLDERLMNAPCPLTAIIDWYKLWKNRRRN